MGQRDGLGPLEVGIPGNNHVEVLTGLSEERPLHILEARLQRPKVISQIQPEIERDLIVPAPAGMKLSSHRAHEFRQPAFHRHMNVLVRIRERETVFTKLVSNLFEPAHQGAPFRTGQDFGFFQGLAMGEAAQDIVFEQLSIEGQGGCKAFDQFMRRFGEATGPGF
jgi:hypothetical protein